MAMVTMSRTLPFVEATPLLSDPAALRRHAEKEGYLFFRGLLKPAAVLNVRNQVLELCRKHGWLSESHPLTAGFRKPELQILESSDPRWVQVYRQILCLHDFHALAMAPAILDALGLLFGEAVVTHSRNICRVVFPTGGEFTTPPHQDHLYIRGSQNTWTCWIPLGDCPAVLGGLAVLPGTHHLGFLPARPGKGAGGQQVDVPEDAVWAAGEFRCGDVILFHSLAIHQGRDNATEDQLRLSVDYRYQPLSEPVHPSSMLPHMAGFGLTWEDIYAGWPPNDPLKYFWKTWNLQYTAP